MKNLKKYLEYLAIQELTTYHYKTLLLIETSSTQAELSPKIGISRQNINKIIKYLEAKGYIVVVRIEGRNKFYKAVLNIEELTATMKGQLKFK